jgi:hypothetical protein
LFTFALLGSDRPKTLLKPGEHHESFFFFLSLHSLLGELADGRGVDGKTSHRDDVFRDHISRQPGWGCFRTWGPQAQRSG